MSQIALLTTSFPQFPSDPSGHFVLADAEARAAAGDHVTVLCPGPTAAVWNGREPREPSKNSGGSLTVQVLGSDVLFCWPGAGTKLRQNPLRFPQALPFAARARRALERGSFDKVVAHWLLPCGWPLGVGAQLPLEVRAHGSDVRLLAALPGPLRKHIASALMKHTLVFASQQLRGQFAECLSGALARRAGECRVELPPLALPIGLDRQRARQQLGLGEERIALCVGRAIPSKRLDVALTHPLPSDYYRVVVGDGPELASLKHAFPEVRFTGRLPRTETLCWIAAADLMLSASVLEGAPTAIREALALGTPVWSAPAGDLAQWADTHPLLRVVSELGER